MFTIPIVGYVLRIPIGILKLPRLNAHVRRLETQLRRLEADVANHVAVEAQVAKLYAQMAGLQGLAGQVSELESIAARLTALDDALGKQVPTLLNAVETIPALAHQVVESRKRIEQLETSLDGTNAAAHTISERIESVGQELLPRPTNGNPTRSTVETTSKILPRIISVDKVAAALRNGTLCLNLGCGHRTFADHVNVDVRALPGVDVVADVAALPFERGSVCEIFSVHLVDCFSQETMRRQLLPYWYALLRPGGIFRVVTLDAAATLECVAARSCDFAEFRNLVFGKQAHDEKQRLNLFTPDSLRALLEDAGFEDITVPVRGRQNGSYFEFEVTAKVPSRSTD